MYLGIDIGTSSVKAVVMDDNDRPAAVASAPLALSHPLPLWSEQAPQDWWQAVVDSLDALANQAPATMAAVRGIGLSGQMLGVALSMRRHAHPAGLLWNDGRASTECADHRCLKTADIVGCPPMPGSRRPSCCG
jgi:xylulokinase